MDKSYYKNGELFEKFTVYHMTGCKIRNRTEAFMIDEIKNTCSKPINCTIEVLRNAIITVMNDIISLYPRFGKCTISELQCNATMAGNDNWQERHFCLYAPGRKIRTLSVSETVMKDADNNWEVIPGDQLVYNRIETIE